MRKYAILLVFLALLTVFTVTIAQPTTQQGTPAVTVVGTSEPPPGIPTDELPGEPTSVITSPPGTLPAVTQPGSTQPAATQPPAASATSTRAAASTATTVAATPATPSGSMDMTAEVTSEMMAEATDEMLGDEGAHVRFAHFAPDAPAVDVYVNGSTMSSMDSMTESESTPESTPDMMDGDLVGLMYPSMTDWMTVEAGSVSVAVVPANGMMTDAVIGPVDVELLAGAWYTVAVIGSLGNASINAVVIQEAYDDLLPGTGGLTFLNALEGSPTVDLNRDDVVFFATLDYPALEGGTYFSTLIADSGVYDFRVTANDDPANELAATMAQELQENAYTFIALIGTADAPELFIDVTDRSEVAIQKGLLPLPGTLVDALGADENLTALQGAIEAAGLSDALTGEGEYTIFAPANFALDEVDMTGMSQEQIQQTLLGHVVEGKLTSQDILNNGPFTTLAGTTLEVTVEGNTIFVNGVQVIAVNIPATNGVIHMLNAILPADGMGQ